MLRFYFVVGRSFVMSHDLTRQLPTLYFARLFLLIIFISILVFTISFSEVVKNLRVWNIELFRRKIRIFYVLYLQETYNTFIFYITISYLSSNVILSSSPTTVKCACFYKNLSNPNFDTSNMPSAFTLKVNRSPKITLDKIFQLFLFENT